MLPTRRYDHAFTGHFFSGISDFTPLYILDALEINNDAYGTGHILSQAYTHQV